MLENDIVMEEFVTIEELDRRGECTWTVYSPGYTEDFIAYTKKSVRESRRALEEALKNTGQVVW